MTATSVSILVPLLGRSNELPSTIETVERYLQTTGFEFDVRVLDTRDGNGYGAMLRRGVADAHGSVVIIIDPELPYDVAAIGDAVALITSSSTDIVFATHDGRDESRHALIRSLLVPIL